MEQLEDRAAVVTGGTSGIGLATAERFAVEGAYVFITGRRQDALDDGVGEIGPNATGIRGDVSDPADLDRLCASVAGRDVFFANALGGESAIREPGPDSGDLP
ncbi:SDR family NAD(P)-dependent oxidoreductase [Streptomyces bungoensis]|uniref:SDR family NAD(P)-dependent oxidoreductase n=1 Tax=Streptomyces bungoensis TaxID=285568 RepID=UPI00099E81C3